MMFILSVDMSITMESRKIIQLCVLEPSHKCRLKPIRQDDGYLQESYLVECRSVSGYSGSPVLVEIPPWSRRPGKTQISSAGRGPWLLGVNWGHLNDWKPVCDKSGKPLAATGMKVGLNSGMMGVVPAWKLSEMFFYEDVVAKRREAETHILGDGPPIASSNDAKSTSDFGHHKTEVQAAPETDNPVHKEDFTRLLNAASRKQPQSD